MTKLKIKQVEKRLKTAALAARAAGKRIIRGEFYREGVGRKKPACCLIEALCPGIGKEPDLTRAQRELDLSSGYLGQILEGFDGGGTRPFAEDAPGPREFFDMGVRLRRELHVR